MRDVTKRPPYWVGKTERLFTRMLEDVRIALVVQSHKEKRNPKNIIEEAIIEFVASGEFDARKRYKNDKTSNPCTYRIDTGVADQLRSIASATGETMQTVIHEALLRKLKLP